MSKYIFTKNEIENAKKRFNDRIKKGTSKNYNKYFKKLMSSFKDVRSKI